MNLLLTLYLSIMGISVPQPLTSFGPRSSGAFRVMMPQATHAWTPTNNVPKNATLAQINHSPSEEGISEFPAASMIGVKLIDAMEAEASIVQVASDFVEEAAAIVAGNEVDLAENGLGVLKRLFGPSQSLQLVSLEIQFNRIWPQSKLIDRRYLYVDLLGFAEFLAGGEQRGCKGVFRDVERGSTRCLREGFGVEVKPAAADFGGPFGEGRIGLKGVDLGLRKETQEFAACFEVVGPAVDDAFGVRSGGGEVGRHVAVAFDVQSKGA